MFDKRILIGILICAAVLVATATMGTAVASGPSLSPQQELGKLLFFDANLSDPPGQACAACHAPEVGYTGPNQFINTTGGVYEGAVPGRYGNRKPPAAAYAGDAAFLHYDAVNKTWLGGTFWDGRATGARLGDPLAEQAQGPFLNPLEQNNASAKVVIDKALASYGVLFQTVCGTTYDVNAYYTCIGRAIAAYERSSEVSAYSSKYDAYMAGTTSLTAQEQRGLTLFQGKAKCSGCHPAPLFTDYSYDNLGMPRNPQNPFYKELAWNPQGENWIDSGLGGYLKSAGYLENVYEKAMGKFKAPTLRNVDKRPSAGFVKAFGHNGYFKSLQAIVHFYNTRDALPVCGPDTSKVPGVSCWPKAEVQKNINRTEMGKLGLTTAEEADLIAFLKTLTDR